VRPGEFAVQAHQQARETRGNFAEDQIIDPSCNFHQSLSDHAVELDREFVRPFQPVEITTAQAADHRALECYPARVVRRRICARQESKQLAGTHEVQYDFLAREGIEACHFHTAVDQKMYAPAIVGRKVDRLATRELAHVHRPRHRFQLGRFEITEDAEPS
jgi:hypothetical protein